MALSIDDRVSVLRGVGPKRADALKRLGIETIGDLLLHMPFRYEDRRNILRIADVVPGARATVAGIVESVDVRRSGGNNKLYIATVAVADSSACATVVFFGGARSFGRISEGIGIAVYGVPEEKNIGRKKIIEFASPEYAVYDAKGGVPADWRRIAPIYQTTSGMPRAWLSNLISGVLLSLDDIDVSDDVPESILRKRGFRPLREAMRGIHAPQSPDEIESSRRRIAYQEFFDMRKKIRADNLSYAGREAYSLSSGMATLERFIALLPFELTGSQRESIGEISRDIGGSRPMRRLLHGDVGSGKTLVALAAAVQCAGAGCQTAVLVPTTVLCGQFFSECVKYLTPLGVRCGELRGGAAKRERAALLDGVASGEIDVLVGTHALTEDDVAFKSLGLLIVDEQHRFGVRQREALYSGNREGLLPHVLSMSATPIPRTLCMALYGDIEVSAIREKPACRKPVVTKILSDNHIGELYAFLSDRLLRGDRCFWICPLIDGGDDCDSSVTARAADMERRVPTLRVERLYGSMSGTEKISAVTRFSSGESNVLVSTTVVEVGVDVPEAGIMVIEGASRFGLSTLHQLRGRVGRGSRSGVCILLDSASNLASNRRMNIMLETDDCFEIAEEDLRIRGAGEIAGLRQHGFAAFRAANIPGDVDLLEFARDDAAEVCG